MALHAGTQHDAVHPRVSHTAVVAKPGCLTYEAGQTIEEQGWAQHVCGHALNMHVVVLASPAFFMSGAAHVYALQAIVLQHTSLQLVLSPHVVVDASPGLRVRGEGQVYDVHARRAAQTPAVAFTIWNCVAC